MKHAYLIIAHNEFEILQMLVSSLDIPENDLFIHIDKKVKSLPDIKVQKARLCVLENRLDVRWGTVSQIKVELHLMKTALQAGPYAHYHIISGTHLPLKPIEDINQFYEAHPSDEIMRLWPEDAGEVDFKLRRYHFPIRDFKHPHKLRRAICQKTWTAVLKFQKIFKIRHLTNCTFYKSDNWLSLTEQACHTLVDHESAILKKYRWSFCGDEYFIASELIEEGFFSIQDCPTLLFVEFIGDGPRTLSLSEYQTLCQSPFLWGRKFGYSNFNHKT